MLASWPDLLRLLTLPAFAWVAYRDVRTRRVPNRTWYPLAALALLLLAWELGPVLLSGPATLAGRRLLLGTALSVGIVVPLSYGFWLVGGFGGELNPTVMNPDDRAPSFHGKLGIDRNLTETVRVRLTGSAYYTASSNDGQLHSGDRAGSRYYSVVGSGDWSGRIRSGFGDQVTSFMINPFVKIAGLELFGTIETISGEAGGLSDGSANQYAAEAIYRFWNNDLFIGARYNTMSGDLNLAGRGERYSLNPLCRSSRG